MKSNKQSFVKGALVLTVSGIIAKVLGAIYRIPLGQIITSEGMAYYQTAYDLYILALNFSSYSIPIAISKLVSERIEMGRKYEAHKVFKIALSMLAILGAILSIILFLNAKYFSSLVKNPGSYYAILAVSPAIFTVSISAAYRGYFQGMQNMNPSAVSQVIEQITRVSAGFVLAVLLLPLGFEQAASGAVFGTVIGGLFSFISLYFIYLRSRKSIYEDIKNDRGLKVDSTGSIIRRIIRFSIPITIGGSIMPIMGLLDTFIVMDRLQAAGFSQQTATMLFGQLKAIATSFINLPQVFTISLAVSLVPSISESMAKKDIITVKKKSELAIKMSMLLGLPAAAGLFVLANPIMQMFYPKEPATLGMSLKYLSSAIVFLTLVQTMTGILQGMNKEKIPVINLTIGAIVKAFISYFLTSIPSINIKGAALGTVIGYAVATVLNLKAIIKYQGKGLGIVNTMIKPIFVTIVMSVVAFYVYNFTFTYTMKNSLSTLISIFASISVYLILIIITGGLNTEELNMIPGGQKLSKLLKKKGIV